MSDLFRRVVRLLLAVGTGSVLCLLPTGTALATGAFLTHGQAVAQLRAAGITWASSGRCVDRNKPSCTSFDGIRPTTIKGVRTLRTASGCPLNVTGGTETGHLAGVYSHWNGYKVDLSHNACLDRYIKATFAVVGPVPYWGFQFKALSGNLYTDERSHWDVLYYTCGCRSPRAARG